ncbi:unnamed protein product [Fusarium graminearum]|nr:unnamed protein product [Fusarium graminearum]
MVYKKMWILLNLGCKFLGHGLKQDFRVINIHIPKSQVIDTIDLFFLKNRLRKLSLAFLAWHLLKEDIQMETHDSIEDSRTALKLYKKYLEYQDAGILELMLQDIYRVGREVAFKPPRKDDQQLPRSDTPPPLPADNSTGPVTPVRNTNYLAQTPGSAFGGASGWTPGKGSPLPQGPNEDLERDERQDQREGEPTAKGYQTTRERRCEAPEEHESTDDEYQTADEYDTSDEDYKSTSEYQSSDEGESEASQDDETSDEEESDRRVAKK